jgi:hypothetical protein
MESASTALWSIQPQDVLPPKRAPVKDPPFCLDGKTEDHILPKFPAARSNDSPTRWWRVCLKTNKVVNLGGIFESVVLLYFLGNVIPGTTLSVY